MYELSEELVFPHPSYADEYGVLAVGGDLSCERLALAYRYGIFPWFEEGEPIVWWSPSERFVLFPEELYISKSMKQVIRSNRFQITKNRAFEQVIAQCKAINRRGQQGTWITTEMQQAYIDFHQKGFAESIEVWEGNALVGGLYGVVVGDVFCGESMFSKVANTSKLAFTHLVTSGGYTLIDCQVHTKHLESLGARHIDRTLFLEYLGVSSDV